MKKISEINALPFYTFVGVILTANLAFNEGMKFAGYENISGVFCFSLLLISFVIGYFVYDLIEEVKELKKQKVKPHE